MLSASIPSRSATPIATWRMRSRDSPVGCLAICTMYCTLYTTNWGGRRVAGRSTVRGLVWLAFGAQLAFVASWIVAGALQPGYSHAAQGVSALAARAGAHPWIVTTGIAVLGASFIALALALAITLPRRRVAPVALFAAVGVVFCAPAALRLDCGAVNDPHCNDLFEAGRLSWQHSAHVWLSLVSGLLLLGTPLALAYSLGPGTTAAVALSAASFGVVFTIVSLVGFL